MNATKVIVDDMLVTFAWFDYCLFIIMLLLSVVIGVYFGCFGHQNSISEYLHGGKEMSVIPIAISLVASTVSGITMLGVPNDVYRFGSTYYLYVSMLIPVYFVTCYVYLPVFHKLQMVSVYEYMMRRFDRKLRLFTSGLSTLAHLLYLPIVVYIPALALAQATQFNLHLVTPILCTVCIFYTTIGGLKAVVWTDTLQFIVMLGSIIGVCYEGTKIVGGFGEVWARADAGRRLDFDLNPDVTKRDTILATMIGTFFGCLSYTAIGQSYVQKYLSLPTKRQAHRAMFLFVFGMFLIISFAVLTGLIMYARYHECDPFTAGKIAKHDQVLPYFVMDVAVAIPGLAGLFLSGIFSAALSTMSACMNCLAGSIYEDFISPFMAKDITQKQISNILKLLVVIIGVISTMLVFVIEHMGGILTINFALSGITNGPLLGLFSLGILFPMANKKGAIWGGIGGMLFMCFIIIGSQYHQVMNNYEPKPISTVGCLMSNNITAWSNTSKTLEDDKKDVFILFKITHYYYCCLGTLSTMIFGLLVSYFTRDLKDSVDPDLISPFTYWVLNKFSASRKKKEYHDIKMAAMTVVTHVEKQTYLPRNT